MKNSAAKIEISKSQFEIEVKREVDDGLGLSEVSMERVQAGILGAFKQGFLQALDEDKILPTKAKIRISFEIEGKPLD